MKKIKILISFLTLAFVLSGCDSQSTASTPNAPSRDATPEVLIPEASGTETLNADGIVIDISHKQLGYMMIQVDQLTPRVKVQITNPDSQIYTYDKYEGFETFPLTGGNGTYQVAIYRNVSGTTYTKVYQESFDVTLDNDFITFLYPNQYVWFDASSQAVKQGEKLAQDCKDDLDVVGEIFHYIIDNVSYDYDKAQSVESGYIPHVDQTLADKKGICFDYASLMATMLRSQRIPTRLEIGYAGDVYHAWISVYTKEEGWIDDYIQFNGENWQLMDPTLTAGSDEETTNEYLNDKSYYQVKYLY